MSDEQDVISFITERITDWETGMSEFFARWNEWASSYEMKYTDGDRRPQGISKNVTAETPRAVNTLATSITRMQTSNDPPFELRLKGGLSAPDSGGEEKLFNMERIVDDILIQTEFKRNLLKGNRGLCLFGTQIWEKPLIIKPRGAAQPNFQGTALKPLSLLQVAFDSTAFEIESSDFLAPITRHSGAGLRNLAQSNPAIWDRDAIEEAIKESGPREDGTGAGETGFSRSNIEHRRINAGYSELKKRQLELVLFSGRLPSTLIETPLFQEMWQKFGRTDDPLTSDITIGVLDRRKIIRFHPTPYGSWHHMYNIGHYIEFELEPMGYGVGALGNRLQKDMNRIMRYANDVAKFSLFNMFLAGRGSGLKSQSMNIFPWSVVPVDDVNQVKELRPQIEGITNGLKLQEFTREDFRAVTHASSTLQAVITGATATESSLAQSEALRAIGLTAEVNGDSVLRPYFTTLIINLLDQNPYDTNLVPVDMIPKLVTDKDYKPEYARRLLEFLNATTTIRNVMPIDFDPMPIIKYLARSVNINPREISKPRPQIDKLLEIMRRLGQGGGGAASPDNEAAGEAAGSGAPDQNVAGVPGETQSGGVPTSPLDALGVL